MIRKNPAFVVSTNNTRLVPEGNKKASPEDVKAFQEDLKKELGEKESKKEKATK